MSKKAWERIRQQATMFLWEKIDYIKPIVDKVREDLPVEQTVNQVYEEIKVRAKKAKVELPVGLMDVRLHDIRRTFGSYQALAGASLQMIGKTLGHKSQQSTEVYAHLNNAAQREATEMGISEMMKYIEGE